MKHFSVAAVIGLLSAGCGGKVLDVGIPTSLCDAGNDRCRGGRGRHSSNRDGLSVLRIGVGHRRDTHLLDYGHPHALGFTTKDRKLRGQKLREEQLRLNGDYVRNRYGRPISCRQ